MCEYLADIADRSERITQLMRQHGEKFVLAPIGIAQLPLTRTQRFLSLLEGRKLLAGFILTLAAAQRRLHCAEECAGRSRALQESNVGEGVDRPRYDVGLSVGWPKQHDRQI